MDNDKHNSNLRKKAEEEIGKVTSQPDDLKIDHEKILHELKVYQIELKIQNEELRNSQLQLQKSHDSFLSLFRHAPLGYVVLDDRGVIRKTNDTFSEMINVDRSEILNRNLVQFIYQDDQQIFLGRFKAIFKQPESKTMEMRLKNGDKEVVRVQISAVKAKHFHLDDASVDVDLLLLSFTDITNLHQAEQKEKELLNRFELISQNLPGVIFQFRLRPDGSSHFPYASPGIEKIYGVQPADVEHNATAVFDALHPEDFERVNASISHSAQTLNHWHDIYRVNLPTGEIIWVEGNSTPQKLEDGSVIWHGFIQDITERKLAEQQIFEAKENAELGAETIKIKNNEILFNNERLESLLKVSQLQTNSVQELLDFALKQAVDLTKSKIGYIYFYVEERKQFILNTWSKDVMKECTVMNPQTVYDLDKTGCWGEAVRQRKPIMINDYNAENPIKKGTPDGHVKLEKFLTIPVILDNKIVAVAGVANKSTNYNSSDIRQLTLLMDNVWKISERLALIKDLRLAKEKAEESDRLKSAFLANMSHEIRTPMNGIMGFSELLKSSNLSGEQQKSYIEIIEKSGKRMLNIINDIMSISKIESGTMDIYLKETNINNQMQFVYDVLKFDADKKKLSLSYNYKISDKAAIFITDTEKFYGILSNLVNNAIKYTDSGTVEYGYINKGKEFEFYVKDTGIGIPKDRQEAIFERFIQADIADTMARQGAGLGLAISRAYVAMLGGKIWVESEEGKGSTFYFSLPSNNDPGAETNDSKHSNSEKCNDVRKLKILIAEDDDDSLLLMKETVRIWSKEILTVSNGVKAVEVCRSNSDIDLILMDIRMPDMGGYEATRQIREFNKKVLIIAQTAYAQAGDREKAIDVGCNDYIAKPIRIIELQALIEKYFGK